MISFCLRLLVQFRLGTNGASETFPAPRARRRRRRAAAAVDVVVRAAKNQRRHFYLRRIAEGIPGAPRLVVIAMLLRARLPSPERIGERAHHFGMLAIEFLAEGHAGVLDMAADKALEAVLANLL